MKKVDTRVQFTKEKFHTAILELMQEKPIAKITVKEICERAGLNRGTFYLHYDTPHSLMKEVEQQFLEENTRLFYSFWQKGREQNIMVALFSCLKENSDSFRIFIGPNGDPDFLNDLFSDMRGEILKQWQAEFPAYSMEALDFIFDYVVIGSTRLIQNWLNDTKGITATQFAHRIERLGHYALVAIQDF